MCTYNREDYVREAIDSVLAQDDPNVEIVVVDDASTDRTGAVLGDYGDRIRVIRSDENRGTGISRNRGLCHSDGELVAFLDDDDVLPPGSLSIRRAMLGADPDADVASGRIEEFLSPEVESRLRSEGVRARAGLSGPVTAAMVRRQAFTRIGAFEELRHAACINWMMRARSELRFVETDEIVYRRRLHHSNVSRSDLIDHTFRFEAIRRARAMQRGVDTVDTSLD